MLEVNSETDFVGRDENFLGFADAVARTALAAKLADVQALADTLPSGRFHMATVEEARQALVAKVGENINVRRVAIPSMRQRKCRHLSAWQSYWCAGGTGC